MGVPAVLRILSDDHDGAFITEWAPPERVIPGFARWIEQCRTSHVTPTAANYHDFAVSDPEGDHFRDSYAIGATDPDTIEYRYVSGPVPTATDGSPTLIVYRAHARPDREPLLTVWHSIRFSNADTSSIHQLAFRAVIS